MWEINVADLSTDSQEFPIAREAILGRYERLRAQHLPAGEQTFKRDASARERTASSYTVVTVEHADIAMRAFGGGHYPPGFALARPALEGLIKQFLIGEYADEDDGWQRIVRSQDRITVSKLQELTERFPELAHIVPLWKTLAPILNDFVHGGVGQLTSNPIDAVSKPRYPGAWFWSTALVYTVCMLATSGWFWVHIGEQERAKALVDAVAGEDWASITTMRNGQIVRIFAAPPSSAAS